MRYATQADIDEFMSKYAADPEIFPYLAVSQHWHHWKEHKDDWSEIMMINDSLTCILTITLERDKENAMKIGLYSKNAFSAGRAIKTVKQLITRYNPKCISSSVHESNDRSVVLNTKIFGEPWGVEPCGAWNGSTGEWEGLVKFKKILR